MSTTPTLSSPDVDTLAASLSGRLLQPGDEGYDDARRVHNGLIDRRPALIVRCRSAADVAAAVRFARVAGTRSRSGAAVTTSAGSPSRTTP